MREWLALRARTRPHSSKANFKTITKSKDRFLSNLFTPVLFNKKFIRFFNNSSFNLINRYSSEELKYLPVNTVIYDPPAPKRLSYLEWKRQLQNPRNKVPQSAISSTVGTTPQTQQPQRTILSQQSPMISQYQNITPSHLGTQPRILSASATPNSVTTRRSTVDKPIKYAESSEDEDSRMDYESTKTKSAAVPIRQSIRVTANPAPTVAKLVSIAPQTSVAASSSATATSSSGNSSTATITKTCCICQKPGQQPAHPNASFIDVGNQYLIDCNTCHRASHPSCLELNSDLVDWVCIRQYDWQCMDCKLCSTCNSAQDEDKMMFCDRCDRGFHTYCVGVAQVPAGSWLCLKCEQFKERLASINDKISSMKKESASTPNRQHLQSALLSSSSSLTRQLKPRLSEIDERGGAGSPHTPAGGSDKRGRGRPPGSLNKPKDPNSPSKKIM
jgi:hypothetical protein